MEASSLQGLHNRVTGADCQLQHQPCLSVQQLVILLRLLENPASAAARGYVVIDVSPVAVSVPRLYSGRIEMRTTRACCSSSEDEDESTMGL